MKTSILGLLVVTMMAGCAAPQPTIWNKAGGTEEQFRRDRLTCRQYGMQAAQMRGLSGNLFVEVAIMDEMRQCLRGLGYHEMGR